MYRRFRVMLLISQLTNLYSFQALRIHCSFASKELLEDLGGYHIEERGLVPMKVQLKIEYRLYMINTSGNEIEQRAVLFQGKGEVRTYWVVGEDRERRMSRLAPPKSGKSPLKIADLPRPLQKMPSAPSIRFSSSTDEYKPFDCPAETDKLLNGMLPHGLGYDRDFKTQASRTRPS